MNRDRAHGRDQLVPVVQLPGGLAATSFEQGMEQCPAGGGTG